MLCAVLLLALCAAAARGEDCDGDGVGDSNCQCQVATQYLGTCRTRASCDDNGVSTGTGTCPGAEQCCTVERCYVQGVEGICVNPDSCSGTTHRNYCTGVGVCCTKGAAPDCQIASTSASTVIEVRNIKGKFVDGDREAVTQIQYCEDNCDAAIEPKSDSQVRWATPKEPGFKFKSGLGFKKEVGAFDVPVNELFPIGTLTHYNFVVTGATPTFVHLEISMRVNSVKVPPFRFQIGIEETDNQLPLNGCAYPSVVVCADRINFPNLGFAFNNADRRQGSVKFRLPGTNVDLTLELAGFKQNCDLPIINEWYTQEKVINQAVLYGRITRACPIADDCIGEEIIYAAGNCHCKNGAKPTPAPPTPSPTPPPPGMSGGPKPKPSPAPTPFVIETPPQTEQTTTKWTGWQTATPFVAPTPPTQPPDDQIIVTKTEEEEEFPIAIVAGAAGGIACLALLGILAAWLIFTSSGAAVAASMGFGAGKDQMVQNNPLFDAQTEEHMNPIHYPQPGAGASPGYVKA